jgi:hypothetical protein
MTIEKKYPRPPTPKEIKILQEIRRLRDLTDSMGQDNIKYLQEIERLTERGMEAEAWCDQLNAEIRRLQAYVEEWKIRYETARLAHEEGREEIRRLAGEGLAIGIIKQLNNDNERLQHRIVTLEGMLGDANIAIPE